MSAILKRVARSGLVVFLVWMLLCTYILGIGGGILTGFALFFVGSLLFSAYKAEFRGERLALLAASIGACSFFAPTLLGAYKPSFLSQVELPNADPNGIAVDPSGNAYIGSRAFARIQKYDSSGFFQKGWYAPSGVFALEVTQDNLLRVCALHRRAEYYYNTEGDAVSEGQKNSCNADEYRKVLGRTKHIMASWLAFLRIDMGENRRPLYVFPPLLMVPLWDPHLSLSICFAAIVIAAVMRKIRGWSTTPRR